MTTNPPPTPQGAAARTSVRRGVGSVAIAVLVLAGAARAVGGTPYDAVVDALLTGFRAESRACEAEIAAPWPRCFAVEPARASLLAEWLESFVDEQQGAIVRGAWSSVNGTHRVDLTLRDGAWGTLELWLTEFPDQRVEGRLEIRPAPRR
jgi:hypothetical protein